MDQEVKETGLKRQECCLRGAIPKTISLNNSEGFSASKRRLFSWQLLNLSGVQIPTPWGKEQGSITMMRERQVIITGSWSCTDLAKPAQDKLHNMLGLCLLICKMEDITVTTSQRRREI